MIGPCGMRSKQLILAYLNIHYFAVSILNRQDILREASELIKPVLNNLELTEIFHGIINGDGPANVLFMTFDSAV